MSPPFHFQRQAEPTAFPDTERVMRTIKEDIVWCYDWDHPLNFQIALTKWINDYNNDFPHQSLNNMTPNQFHEHFLSKNSEPVLT